MKKQNLMMVVFAFYGAMFWLLNGADKFLNRTDIGIFNWYGKNRLEQFEGYFQSLGVPNSAIEPLLYFFGVVELVIFVPFAVVVFQALKGQSERALVNFRLASVASVFVFSLFSGFDVLVGDRAELLEHGTFIAVFMIGYVLVLAESFVGKVTDGSLKAISLDRAG